MIPDSVIASKANSTPALTNATNNVPWSKYFVTIDHSFLNKTNRSIISKSAASKFFVANYASNQLTDNGGKIICTKTKRTYNLSCFDVIIRSRAYGGLGKNWNDFRNGNCSGYCAMQLAALLGYNKIYLLGIDLVINNGATHYHGGYGRNVRRLEKNLGQYYKYFVKGIAGARKMGIKIFSCSSISKLNGLIPFVKASEAL